MWFRRSCLRCLTSGIGVRLDDMTEGEEAEEDWWGLKGGC